MTHPRGLVPTSAVGARALYCTEDGVFVWPNIPLIRRRLNPGRGSYFAKCDPLTAWRYLAPWHGEDVNGSTLAGTLTSACAYLNAGDAAEARKWVDRLPLPPLTQRALAKLGHWQMQPRASAGTSEGGRWIEDSGNGFSNAVWNSDNAVRVQYVADIPEKPPGIGHNNPPEPIELDPIEVTPEPTSARFPRLGSVILNPDNYRKQAKVVLLILRLLAPGEARKLEDQINEWEEFLLRAWDDLPNQAANFLSAREPARGLGELHPLESGRNRRSAGPGFQWHHIVEQGRGRPSFGNGQIEDRTNLVRVPTYVHEAISAWYTAPNAEYGGLSPRDYLRDKPFDFQYEFGLRILREFKVIYRPPVVYGKCSCYVPVASSLQLLTKSRSMPNPHLPEMPTRILVKMASMCLTMQAIGKRLPPDQRGSQYRELFEEFEAIWKVLREREDGPGAFLAHLSTNRIPHVRYMAARTAYHYAPEICRPVLEALADGDFADGEHGEASASLSAIDEPPPGVIQDKPKPRV